MKSEPQYFNFPIQLLEGFLTDNKSHCLQNALFYHLYTHSLKLERGKTELEKMKDSAKFFNVTLGNPVAALKVGKTLYDSLPDKSPITGINSTIFWGYFNKEKSEFEKVCLLGFLAIKSILGTKAFCKITNDFWLSRMDGKAKCIQETEQFSEPLMKFANEYQTRKIKNELRNWGLTTYSRYTRGFYVSLSLSLERLVFEAEKCRKSTKDKQYKAKEAEAVRQAHEALKRL